jgi:hypothetical protein
LEEKAMKKSVLVVLLVVLLATILGGWSEVARGQVEIVPLLPCEGDTVAQPVTLVWSLTGEVNVKRVDVFHVWLDQKVAGSLPFAKLPSTERSLKLLAPYLERELSGGWHFWQVGAFVFFVGDTMRYILSPRISFFVPVAGLPSATGDDVPERKSILESPELPIKRLPNEWPGYPKSPCPWDDGELGVYPNPFNPTTTIHYVLAQPTHVTLKVFNLLGQEVATLVDVWSVAGNYEVSWGPGNLPSGIYFIWLQAGGNPKIMKVRYVK